MRNHQNAHGRRGFIRLVGGGMVGTGFASMTACSTDYPPESVAAWQGPGDEADPRRWALCYALLAPNSHNRQPWLADLRESGAITLHVDRERTLPMTDPWYRQIIVSQGTFIELLVIALKERGLDPLVDLFPQGEFTPRALDARPVARINWVPGAAAPPKDPLFAQILRRHTAKVDYDTARPVAASTIAALQATHAASGVREVHFGATIDPARMGALRSLCIDAAKVELSTARTAMESLRLMRVGPGEIARHRDGISLNGWMPRVASALGLFDRSEPPAEGSGAYRRTLALFEGHSRTAMGFVWLSTPTEANARANRLRSAEVEAGRAYMRLQLKATELGLQMHPMSQAAQEFDEMKPWYERMHALLVHAPAIKETVQMFCRVGYCAEQPHSPRRDIGSIIRA